MSLADPNEEYSELVPEGKNRIAKFLKKLRLYLVVLIIGLLIGAYLQYAYLTPLFNAAQLSSCSDCTRSKVLLNQENACLYSLMADPHSASAQCRQIQQNGEMLPPATMPINPDANVKPPVVDTNARDFNEEAPQL